MSDKSTFIIVIIVIAVGCLAAWHPRDDSDSPTERSGMAIRHDALTGCEYFEVRSLLGIALTPRMDADGKQICRKKP